MSTPFLQAISVSKTYPGKQRGGLQKTTLHIDAGKITAIIGESGSGKTTLLRLLYGLLDPDHGEIQFRGERVWGPHEKLIPGHDAMKMVTQHTDDLNLYARVWDNISVLLPNTNLAAKKEKTEQMLLQLNMMHLAEKRIADLSGGEKQRVAIARALVTQPDVLFLDEPFNQVDASFRDGLQEDIRRVVKDTRLTVIIVSHDPAEVLSMADHLIVLKNGEIIEAGTPQEIYAEPGSLYTAKLLTNCNLLNALQAQQVGIVTDKEWVAVYPEWISAGAKGDKWLIRQVLFKGFYEDVLLEKDGLTLRMLNKTNNKLKPCKWIGLKIKRYLSY